MSYPLLEYGSHHPEFSALAWRDAARFVWEMSHQNLRCEVGKSIRDPVARSIASLLEVSTGCRAVHMVGPINFTRCKASEMWKNYRSFAVIHWKPGITCMLTVWPLGCRARLVLRSTGRQVGSVCGVGVADVLRRLSEADVDVYESFCADYMRSSIDAANSFAASVVDSDRKFSRN